MATGPVPGAELGANVIGVTGASVEMLNVSVGLNLVGAGVVDSYAVPVTQEGVDQRTSGRAGAANDEDGGDGAAALRTHVAQR